MNQFLGSDVSVQYWREGSFEVDFILSRGRNIVAIEVKSGRKKESLSGLKKFKDKFPKAKTCVIGPDREISTDDFFKMDLNDWFEL